MRKQIILTALVAAMFALAAAAAPAQCVKHAEGKTALVFDNVSTYWATFYVDKVKMAVLTPNTTSDDLAVAPGQHLLSAVLAAPVGELSVHSVNEVPEGYVCMWHVTDYGSDKEVKVLRGY